MNRRSTMTMMDEAAKRHFLDALRADAGFRDTVRRELLSAELLQLPEVVAGMATKIDGLIDAFAQQRQDLASLTSTVSDLAANVGSLTGTVSSLAGTVSNLVDVVAQQRQDLDELRDHMQRLAALVEEGFNVMGAALTSLQGQVSELRADMQRGFISIDARFDQVNAEIRDIKRKLAS
ncbi:MAG: hypothetical protein ACP5VR_00275 [Acidimicrobiales bacterium]